VERAELAITAIQEDISRVHVRATAALALAGVFVTQLTGEVRAMDTVWRVVGMAGVTLLALSALLYFLYSQKLNRARIAIAAESDGDRALAVQTEWVDPFATDPLRDLPLYTGAGASFALGGACLAVVLWVLFV
jgi:hypothetical protein